MNEKSRSSENKKRNAKVQPGVRLLTKASHQVWLQDSVRPQLSTDSQCNQSYVQSSKQQ